MEKASPWRFFVEYDDIAPQRNFQTFELYQTPLGRVFINYYACAQLWGFPVVMVPVLGSSTDSVTVTH